MHAYHKTLLGLAIVVPCFAASCAGRGLPWRVGDPREERPRAERHDPFPSAELGPDTYTRPQSFTQPRSDVRRIREEEAHRQLFSNQPPGYPPGQSGPPVQTGPSSQNTYPGVVRE